MVEEDTGVAFVDARNMAFIERQRLARLHVGSDAFGKRVIATLRFMTGEDTAIDLTDTDIIAVPDVSACRAAAILAWHTQDASALAEELMEPMAGTNLQVPALFRADLVALSILPGLYPDYRRFLSMLLRLCKVAKTVSTISDGPIIFAQHVTDQKRMLKPKRMLKFSVDGVLAARCLFPSWINAEMTNTEASVSGRTKRADTFGLDPLGVGAETAQPNEVFNNAPTAAAVLDVGRLPKLAGKNLALPSTSFKASTPLTVPINQIAQPREAKPEAKPEVKEGGRSARSTKI